MNTDTKPQILIVDDSPVNIKILVRLLMDEFEISVATNGEEGIEIINSDNRFDLILLDITMPGMDGYEVCRKLKSQDATRNIPVIFITARNEVEEETKGFEVGAVDYITKPFSPAIVKARINTHLDLKRHRDNLVKFNELLSKEIAERKRTEEVLRHLLKKQEINIDLAKNLLAFINKSSPRYIGLSDKAILFLDIISVPCFAEGGDHFFVRTLSPNPDSDSEKTVLSLKDQSGHEVGCVLRSIITDLIHHAIINENAAGPLEQTISDLNERICTSEVFNRDDFFTAITIEIDHNTLMLRHVSAGHPPLLLIRNSAVSFLPQQDEPGTNIPIAVLNHIRFTFGEYQLEPGDKLVLYTDGLMEIPLRNLKTIMSLNDLKQHTDWIIRRNPDITVSDLISSLVQTISEISGEQVNRRMKNTSGDDVSVVGIEIEDLSRFSEETWKPETIEDLCHRIDNLCLIIQHEWRRAGFETPETRIRIVLEEAVLNAWIHGNLKNPEKTITIRWRFGNDFHLEIIDQGCGYNHREIPDPTTEDNIFKQNGRGLYIIRHFADDVIWKKDGRHIIMRFKKETDQDQDHIQPETDDSCASDNQPY